VRCGSHDGAQCQPNIVQPSPGADFLAPAAIVTGIEFVTSSDNSAMLMTADCVRRSVNNYPRRLDLRIVLSTAGQELAGGWRSCLMSLAEQFPTIRASPFDTYLGT
jgi:hypothetical protein